MTEIKYGQLGSWEEGSVSTHNDFMELAEGNNQVRIFTNPYQFVVHWVKDATGTNRKIRCSITNCPLCKKGVKVQFRWLVGVFERRSGCAKILEISSQIYKGIKDLIMDPDWGDVKGYDVNIKRGAKGSQPLYSVIAKKPTPITDDDKASKRAFLERVDIDKFTQPSTPEEIAEKMGSLSGDSDSCGGARFVSGTNVVERSSGTSKPVVDDEDFNFGDDA